MATTFEVGGGYTDFVKSFENAFDRGTDLFANAPDAFKEQIDFTGEELIIGDALGQAIFEQASNFLPVESIAIAADFLQSTPTLDDFQDLPGDFQDFIPPIVFGGSDGASPNTPDLLGLLPDVIKDAFPDSLLDDLNDLFPGRG